MANNILYELYLFHFNLRNDKSILEQTVIQIRFLSIRHINQVLLFQLQHSMTMRVYDLIMKIENMRIFSTKSSILDKSCFCLYSLRELHLLCIAISVYKFRTLYDMCLSVFPSSLYDSVEIRSYHTNFN